MKTNFVILKMKICPRKRRINERRREQKMKMKWKKWNQVNANSISLRSNLVEFSADFDIVRHWISIDTRRNRTSDRKEKKQKTKSTGKWHNFLVFETLRSRKMVKWSKNIYFFDNSHSLRTISTEKSIRRSNDRFVNCFEMRCTCDDNMIWTVFFFISRSLVHISITKTMCRRQSLHLNFRTGAQSTDGRWTEIETCDEKSHRKINVRFDNFNVCSDVHIENAVNRNILDELQSNEGKKIKILALHFANSRAFTHHNNDMHRCSFPSSNYTAIYFLVFRRIFSILPLVCCTIFPTKKWVFVVKVVDVYRQC